MAVRRISVDVKNKDESDALEDALADPEIRTLAIILGALKPLSRESQRKIVDTVSDRICTRAFQYESDKERRKRLVER